MESLGTETGILPIRWILAWIALLQVVIIGAENIDPVQFTFSANFPKNKSLNPLPKHFDKFGDSENDCCTLVLFFEVKDLDMEGTNEDPPKMEGAQAQTGTGEATFKFEHPDIRDTDKSFTMDVAMDQDLVKSRHILNFDTCSSIIQKTYNIFATTSITDVKDVKVIVVNGKDDNIKCKDSTAIRPTPMNSSSFCTDPEEYECKHLGITKCARKLNRSTTQKPLPIEKPPCAVPCLDTDSWCEERGACIAKDEHCDCGHDKIYCTSEDAYSCESRKGILQSNIFNICRNGECRKNCSMAEEEGTEGCGEGQFRCGGSCLDNVEIVQNRTCNQHCISVHKTCYAKQEEVSAAINDSENDWIYKICLCVSGFLILVLFGVSGFVYYRVQSNSKQIHYLNNTTTDHKNISEDSATSKINMLQMDNFYNYRTI